MGVGLWHLSGPLVDWIGAAFLSSCQGCTARMREAPSTRSGTHVYRSGLVGRVCSVHSVEALLSALECCGLDNARIEVEGGGEIPTLDGSAAVSLSTSWDLGSLSPCKSS